MSVGVQIADSKPAAAQSFLRQSGIRSLTIVSADSETLVSFRGYLIDSLRAEGISVGYVGPAVDAATREWLAARAVRIHEIPIRRNTLAPLSDIRTLLALLRVLRRTRPDAVLVMRIKSSIYGLIAAALAGVPYRFALVTGLGYAFTEQPGNRRWRMLNRIVRGLYRLGLRHATAAAFQNADDERDFRRWRLLPDSVPSTVVNGSGVDTAHYAMSALPGGVSCLFAARLLADKGVAEFIEAARIVKAQHPDAVFTVLGPAETNPSAFPMRRLKMEAAKGVIDYRGAVSDIRPFMKACRIFVHPSYYREGVPRSVLEAMAMGRPVITTDVPGCRDTVEPGRNGLLVPPRDAQALAAAILELADDPARAARMGQESRKIAEEKYEVRKVTGDLLTFYGRAALRHGA